MAIVNAGTKNNLPGRQIPTGYERPTVIVFNDGNYKSTSLIISIVKSTVEDASNSNTMDDILSAITTSVDATLANDYVATNTVDAFTTLDGLSVNLGTDGGDDDWLSDVVPTYTCNVTLYVKIS